MTPSASEVSVPARPVQWVRVRSWAKPEFSWLIHGFSTRAGGKTTVYRQSQKKDGADGDLNLGFTASDTHETVVLNRRLFLRAATGSREFAGLVTLQQIHSSLTWTVGRNHIRPLDEPAVLRGDGLMTGDPGVLLGIQTADCLPVLVVDWKRRAVAAFHAGWRGTLARIVEKGVGRMRLEFGSKPEHLIAAIGPGIGSCCYSVGEEVRQQFEAQFLYAAELFRPVDSADPLREKYPMLFLTARPPGHGQAAPAWQMDLAEANRRQLLAAGLKKSAIAVTALCTGCHTDRFFSHRLEQGFTGRMMSVAGIGLD